MNASFRLVSPRAGGALAIIELAGDVEGALAALGAAPVATGRVALRRLAGVDAGLVARWADDCCHLTPHAGPVVVRRICEALERAGARAAAPDLRRAWPEARDLHEARMLDALARAQSPRAVDLLLDQPWRWREVEAGRASWREEEIDAHSRLLDRLVEPALVVAVGAPNIGKSTLLNALARAPVSVVADEPGATRDHVGATIVLDGLAVRWIDTPGLRAAPAPVEHRAMEIALEAARGADLVLRCVMPGAESPWPRALEGLPSLRVGLRADEGESPGAEAQTGAGADGRGVDDLARLIRRRLVPDEALAWPGPWRIGGSWGS